MGDRPGEAHARDVLRPGRMHDDERCDGEEREERRLVPRAPPRGRLGPQPRQVSAAGAARGLVSGRWSRRRFKHRHRSGRIGRPTPPPYSRGAGARRGTRRDRPLGDRARLRPGGGHRRERAGGLRPRRGGARRRARGDRRLGRLHRRHGRARPRERPSRRQGPALRPQPRQGVRGPDGCARGPGEVDRLRRRRPRPRPRRAAGVRGGRAAGGARLRDRLEAAPQLQGALSALARFRLVALPAARPPAFPARRARHPGRAQGVPAGGRRGGHAAAPRRSAMPSTSSCSRSRTRSASAA